MRPSSATITLLLGVLCAGLPALPARADMGPCRLDANEELTCGARPGAAGQLLVGVESARAHIGARGQSGQAGAQDAEQEGDRCARWPHAGRKEGRLLRRLHALLALVLAAPEH